ncbi:uncharacterized protein LOC127852155 [Dreissena polymorpha]|uniref:Uncharacterized protein n=1 Tax=Dreissena polymorpha TaxID=45954 RepID=A0A9D4CM55_DREPO|nr:uncharacterized protein LOC127852155 [Dreissena polymorpha]KAH3727057.1 hypothetical protein DPMN_052983 [Dreissena polymorpha]
MQTDGPFKGRHVVPKRRVRNNSGSGERDIQQVFKDVIGDVHCNIESDGATANFLNIHTVRNGARPRKKQNKDLAAKNSLANQGVLRISPIAKVQIKPIKVVVTLHDTELNTVDKDHDANELDKSKQEHDNYKQNGLLGRRIFRHQFQRKSKRKYHRVEGFHTDDDGDTSDNCGSSVFSDHAYSDGEEIYAVGEANSVKEVKKTRSLSICSEDYVPSWLSKDIHQMNKSKIKHELTISANDLLGNGASWSLNESRRFKQVSPQRGSQASKTDPKQSQKAHEDIEKEYLDLRKHLNTNTNENERQFVAHQHAVRQVHSESPTLPRYITSQSEDRRSQFESDALGINHFKKHILNVKQSSKKFRRRLRNHDDSQKQTKRKPLRFITIYEG